MKRTSAKTQRMTDQEDRRVPQSRPAHGSSAARCHAPTPIWPVLLRRSDQASVAVVLVVALAAILAWLIAHGAARGRLVEMERIPFAPREFLVDVNHAPWPELSMLPGVGETLARRIVEYREEHGPFQQIEELRHVAGLGPKTFQRIRHHVAPIPIPDSMAGRE